MAMTSTSVPILSRYNEPWCHYIKFLNIVTSVYTLRRTAASVTSKRPSEELRLITKAPQMECDVAVFPSDRANKNWQGQFKPAGCPPPPSSVLMLWLPATICSPCSSLAGEGRPERVRADVDSINSCTKIQHALLLFVQRGNQWANVSPVTSGGRGQPPTMRGGLPPCTNPHLYTHKQPCLSASQHPLQMRQSPQLWT